MASQKPIHLALVFSLVFGFALVLPTHHHHQLPLDSSHPTPDQHDSPNDSAHCGICLFGRSLTTPQLIDLRVPQLQLVCTHRLPPLHTPDRAKYSLPFFGRAPPASI